MKNYIDFERVRCKDCFRCLRKCPVKSIKFSDQKAIVVEDECILCGNCYLTCPQGAKEIRQDSDVVKALFKSGGEVYATIAPSFVANYPSVSFEEMTKALKKLGFAGCYETALGATVVKDEYVKLINKGEQNVIISTCCPTVNMLIRKYYPKCTSAMAPVLSPASTAARIIKKEHINSKVVFIGPCLSKKEEVDENPDLLDACLTFEELTLWFKKSGITLKENSEIDKSGLTRLFPTTGGILKTMDLSNTNYNYIAIDGIDNCKKVLEEVSNGNMSPCFIEMSACIGSCIGGPCMDKDRRTLIKNNIEVIKSASKNDFKYEEMDILKTYNSDSKIAIPPSDEVIKMILAKLGKTKPEDELNCGSCGYNTCRDKAIALYYGKTEISMCLPYLKSKAESFRDDIVANTPNGIMVLNENLDIELINKSACEIIRIKEPKDVIGQPVIRILDPTVYARVINTKENEIARRHYLASYDKYVEETVIYDAKYNIVMSIMRDITSNVKTENSKNDIRNETIQVTDKVIEKQMRAVQEIAMLLGETTAETKVALEKLKESLNDK